MDLVLGGSCWPASTAIRLLRGLAARDVAILQASLGRMARALGVPVVHAGHAGVLRAGMPMLGLPFRSFFLGETQIVDGDGTVLARLAREDGEGVIVADLETGRHRPAEPIGAGFWSADLPAVLRASWRVFNWHARRYYARQRRRELRDRRHRSMLPP